MSQQKNNCNYCKGGSRTAPTIFLFLLLLFPIAVFSLSSDQQQVAYLTAARATYNRKTHVSKYFGNIHFSQGTERLLADKLVVYDTKDNKVYKIVAFGKPAHYSVLPDGKKHMLYASANKIEYYPQKHTAVLTGNAKVTQKGNIMRGPHIIYNMQKQTVLLHSSAKNRAKITFQP